MTMLVLFLQGALARQIQTGSAQLDPPKINEIVDLYLMAGVATTVPKDGRIEYIFPPESNKLPYETGKECQLSIPPQLLQVICFYAFTETGRVKLIVDKFSEPIYSGSFFELRIPGFFSPRSTAETDSFEFASYDAEDNQLDYQNLGIVTRATEFNELKSVVFQSTSQVVGKQDQYLQVTFSSLQDLTEGDWLQVKLPKWNRESFAPMPMITYDTNELTCSGILNTRENIDCFLERGNKYDMVTLFKPLKKKVEETTSTTADGTAAAATGPIVSDVIEADSEISFKIGPIRNPISTAPVIGFEMLTLSERQGKIAVGYGSLQVFEPAIVASTKSAVSLTTTETLINKASNFLIEMDVPLPLNSGCQISIYLPKPLYIGAEMNEVKIGGLFGSIRTADIRLDASRNLVSIDNACRTYRQNAVKASFELKALVNPGYVITTDSFIIEISDNNDNPIVRTSGGIVYTTTPGEIYVQSWYASNRLVSALSEITFSIQPRNPTPTSDVRIILYLPSDDFEGVPDPCAVTYYNQLVNPETIICEADLAKNALVISQVLKDAYTYEELDSEYIEFSIDKIRMPSSIRPTGEYKVEFYSKIDDVYRLVDTVTTRDMLRALPGGLLQVNVDPLQGTTYTDDTMTISFLPGHTILKGGYLTIILPPELEFTRAASCKTFSEGFNPDTGCQFNKPTRKLTVRRAFDIEAYNTLERPIVIQIAGIFTPRSVMPTTNFKLETFDSNWWLIDTHKTYFLPAQRAAKSVEVVRVIQGDNIVGRLTTYDLLIKSQYPLYTGDLLTLMVPEQATKDLASTFEYCKGSTEQAYLTESLHTVLIGINNLMIRVQMHEGIDEIPIDAEFGVQIAMLQNPESTRPSDPFYVSITDEKENLVTKITEDAELLKNFVMHATQPNQLVFGLVNNDPKQALEPTLIQLRLDTQHVLPLHSQLKIWVPKQLGLPADLSELKCWIDSDPFGEVVCDFDEDTYTFILKDINPHGSLRGGSSLNVELKGLINRKIAELTDSFEALTLTEDGYMIDRIVEGLLVASNCDWPCWDCPAAEPGTCLKCDARDNAPLPLFFNGQCLDTCPSSYFNMNKVCSQCDEGCLECDQTSKQCLECHIGRFLLGNTCFNQCPFTHHGIMETKTCELCTPPCKTCLGSLTHCMTCDQVLPQSWFFQNKCYEGCPRDVSVEDEGVCMACNPTCKTCDSDYEANFCTSCYGENYLDYFTNTCVGTCPTEVTVAKIDVLTEMGQTKTCNVCDETCRTCDPFDANICTECQADLKMLETEKKCVTQCPFGTAEVWIPLTQDTVCAECAPGCSECVNSREHCTVCQNNFFFHDYSCVKECPTGFKQLDDQTLTCVLEREICPYGHRYNKFGKCELFLRECKVGYVLNADESECIPEPGFHLPFAFLYASGGWAAYILRRNNREKFSRQVLISQLLLGFTALMQLSYIVQLILAYQMGFDFLVGMHQVALFIHFFFNLLTMVAIHMRIRDKPYEHWRDQYTRESRIIATVSTLYSFKATRILYSNFCSKPYFDVVCENRFRTMIRPFFMLTMGCILQSAAILVANVYTIWLLRWGYEIVTLSISSIIMTLGIFGLEIAEFVIYSEQEPNFMGTKDYFSNQLDPLDQKKRNAMEKQKQRLKKSQVKVMSILDEGNDVGIPQDSDSNYSSQAEINQTHKVLLDKRNHNSERKPQENSEFKFENFQMGHIVKVNPNRIDIGEQGQAPALEQMIKKLDEHDRIRKLRQDLDDIADRQKAAYDGTDLPQTDVDADSQNPEPAIIDRYLDEDVRKQLLISTSKQKQKQFRERRQHFEKHRKEVECLSDQEDHGRNVQKQLFQSAGPSCQDNMQTVVMALADMTSPDGKLATLGGQSVLKEMNVPTTTKKKPLQSMITTVKVAKYDDDIGLSSNRHGRRKALNKPDYLSILQHCSDDELERDKLLYDQFYVKFKKEFDDKAQNGELVPNAKLHQSFDEDVLREMYDDFGVCSDFESELSWISYPPNKGFMRDYYENNPVKQAENELFKQKIKIKFQYCNLYRENYSLPPKPEPILKPSVKTQTNAADLQPEEILVSGREGTGKQLMTVNLDFDPFESEEEFIIEESEQLSAIDEDVYKGLIDKVIFEGFSDVDSDVAIALEHESNLLDGMNENSHSFSVEMSRSASRISHAKGSGQHSRARKGGAGVSKKRKRNDTHEDFIVRQAQAKTEAQAARVGLNGRATTHEELVMDGKLGDVYDTLGHLVYDKDYVSRIDEEDAVASSIIKAGSIHSARSKQSKTSRVGSRAGSEHKSSGMNASGDVDLNSASGRPSLQENHPFVSVKKTSENLMGHQSEDTRPEQSLGQNNNFMSPEMDLQQQQTSASHLNQVPGQHQQLVESELRSQFQPYNFDNDLSEDDMRNNTHLSRRDRQLIRAYGTTGMPNETQPIQAEHTRKKSQTSANNKRKRNKSLKMPNRMDIAGSDRGLADAHEQLQQDMNSPDNGILQLVISRDGQETRPEQVENPPSAMVMTQLKANDKAGGDGSELDNTNIVDAETRGGNLSSHGGSKHYGGTAYSAAGFQSSIVGGHMTGSGTEGVQPGQLSGIKAHQFLNAGTGWESDTSNSMILGQFNGLQAQKKPGVNFAQSPGSGADFAATRTDDEQQRRRDLNQTEIQGVDRGDDEVENDFREADDVMQMGGNWSDNGAAQKYAAGRAGSAIEDGDPFSRLGQSYHYPLDRRMTGPQPFQSIGIASKPYKAKHKRRNEQLVEDQRRAKMSMGTNRMHKLENIYIKYGQTNTAQKNKDKQLPPKSQSRLLRAESASKEIANVFMRHQAGQVREIPHGVGYYGKLPASAGDKRGQRRRILGPNLQKQNFIEDGQNIIGGQMFNNPSSKEVPKVKRELWQNP